MFFPITEHRPCGIPNVVSHTRFDYLHPFIYRLSPDLQEIIRKAEGGEQKEGADGNPTVGIRRIHPE